MRFLTLPQVAPGLCSYTGSSATVAAVQSDSRNERYSRGIHVLWQSQQLYWIKPGIVSGNTLRESGAAGKPISQAKQNRGRKRSTEVDRSKMRRTIRWPGRTRVRYVAVTIEALTEVALFRILNTDEVLIVKP